MLNKQDRVILEWLVEVGGHASIAAFRDQFEEHPDLPSPAELYLVRLQDRRLIFWTGKHLTVENHGREALIANP